MCQEAEKNTHKIFDLSHYKTMFTKEIRIKNI